MRMIKSFLVTWLGTVAFFGCSSHLPVQEIPITANPTEEIDRLEKDRAAAYDQQVNVLSPKYYHEATDHLKDAIEARDKGRDTKVILDHVAQGRANLDKANEVAKISRTSLSSVVQARSDAVAAGAPKFLEKEFSQTDRQFSDVSEAVEENDLSGAQRNQGALTDRYRELEVNAIKIDKLGGAQDMVKQAEKEGAKKNAPRTFEEATKALSEADAFISANPHDKAGIQSRADNASASANHLVSVSRQAKVADKNDSESLVLEREALNKRIEAEKTAAAQTQAALAAEAQRRQEELAATQASADALKAQNSQLTNEKLDAQKLDAAKARFEASEADVYRDGNRLVVRLKKIAFPSGKVDLTPASFPTLGKVRQVIADLGPSKVTIEGHTDSVGSKTKNQTLSEGRAAAISSYLVSNGVAQADISTVGYGDTRPLVSNKTKEGRAQNRRVDVIIEPTSVAH